MSRRFQFVALGDLPYEEEDHPDFAALIERINGIAPAFSVHVGDIKKGPSACDTGSYERVLAHFNSFAHPLIYTPGDNDWADCGKPEAGEFDPLERLGELRRIFFADSRSLGGAPMAVQRQGDAPAHPDMVENARWRVRDTVFLTVHVIGDDNNRGRGRATDDEYRDRDAANLDWIEEGFRTAAETQADGLVLITHGNLWVERDRRPKRRYKDKHQQKGFRRTIKAIRRAAGSFSRPVLVVHGDKHRLVIDQPLTVAKSEELPLNNVTRLQVMGDRQIDAVVVTVDPMDASLFSFRRLIG